MSIAWAPLRPVETIEAAGRRPTSAMSERDLLVGYEVPAIRPCLCGGWICHDTKAKDANIRAALIDRFGGPESIRKGGPLYGVATDVWSALAIAVAYADGAR